MTAAILLVIFVIGSAIMATERFAPAISLATESDGFRQMEPYEKLLWLPIVRRGYIVGYASPIDSNGYREWAPICGRVMSRTSVSREELINRAWTVSRDCSHDDCGDEIRKASLIERDRAI